MTKNLNELAVDIRARLKKHAELKSAIEDEFAEALTEFPMQGRNLSEARRNRQAAWSRWLKEEGLEEVWDVTQP